MNAAAHGFGVAIGDCALVREDIAMKRLAIPFDKMLATVQSYYLAYPDCVAGQQKNIIQELDGGAGAAHLSLQKNRKSPALGCTLHWQPRATISSSCAGQAHHIGRAFCTAPFDLPIFLSLQRPQLRRVLL